MFKDRLREARRLAKLTQGQLAEQIGVATSTLTGYEKGNSEPDMKKIEKIMSALGVDANFLWQDEMRAVGVPTESQLQDLSARAAASPAVLREKVELLKERVAHPVSDSTDAVSPDPLFDLLRKYEQLDEHGRLVVDAVLDIEYKRCSSDRLTT